MFYVPNDIEITKDFVAGLIDHTLLSPEATPANIVALCEEAMKYNFYSVCVNPVYVGLAKNSLKGSPVKIASVVGFPLGATPFGVKKFEAEKAVEDGADEVDMVINIGYLKEKKFGEVERDINEVVKAVHPKIVKVIIETCLLTEQEKVIACTIAVSAGARYVKTSTGFSKAGATVEDVALMRSVVGNEVGVKASGGIRDFDTAVKMVKAGASRIGASKSVEIVK
ncbi:MAG: deoxyribose-phosphate aldolase [Caldisericaceae bacterium]